MNATTEPDVVERVRMALAEAGYPGQVVNSDGAPRIFFEVPVESALKAWTMAGATPPDGLGLACLECYRAVWRRGFVGSAVEEMARIGWSCLARGEGIKDCGVDRV